MKPLEVVASPPEANGEKQLLKQNDLISNVGSGEFGLGVLPIPGQQAQQQHKQIQQQQGNLDAQEDDGDRPLKDNLIQQDDQSPDGDLPHKEPKEPGVVPAPALLKDQGNHKVGGGLSGQQEEREAAHLRNPVVDNFDTNNNL